jgi:hypothetical protein
MVEIESKRANDAQRAAQASERAQLRELLDNMLVAEVNRHGGIPPLSKEEMAFREAIAAFLLPKSEGGGMGMNPSEINYDPPAQASEQEKGTK